MAGNNTTETTAVGVNNKKACTGVATPSLILHQYISFCSLILLSSISIAVRLVRKFLRSLNTSPYMLYIATKHRKRFSRKSVRNMQQPASQVKHGTSEPGPFRPRKVNETVLGF
jgi:hypothetical protein